MKKNGKSKKQEQNIPSSTTEDMKSEIGSKTKSQKPDSLTSEVDNDSDALVIPQKESSKSTKSNIVAWQSGNFVNQLIQDPDVPSILKLNIHNTKIENVHNDSTKNKEIIEFVSESNDKRMVLNFSSFLYFFFKL